MKFLALAALTLLVSCGGGGSGSSGSNDKKRDEVVCLCMAQTYITLESNYSLPRNTKILFNNETVFDSCSETPSVAISHSSGLLRFSFTGTVPKNLNLEVMDMGDDCKRGASIFSQEHVPFSRKVISDDPAKPHLEEVTIKI